MAERDACLTVSGSYFIELREGSPAPDLAQYEFKLRCRIIADLPSSVAARILEWADVSGRFEPMKPLVREIPKDKIIRDEPWDRALEGSR